MVLELQFVDIPVKPSVRMWLMLQKGVGGGALITSADEMFGDDDVTEKPYFSSDIKIIVAVPYNFLSEDSNVLISFF